MRRSATIFLLLLLPAVTAHAATTTGRVSIKPGQPETRQIVAESNPPVIAVTAPRLHGSKGVVKSPRVTITGNATDESGVMEVVVNGNVAACDERGKFSIQILLKEGENPITIEALDPHGNKATKSFTITRPSGAATSSKEH